MKTETSIVAVTDPGERDRTAQNAGDRLIVRLSNLFAWIFPLLMLAICAQVILRQAGHNQAWLDDLQWWLYGAAVLIGIGYAVTTNSHVRVDIFYETYSPEKRAKMDVFALGWLFLPFALLCWDVTFDYALTSIKANEGSDSPNGLHNLWILKSFLNLSFVFIAIACWAAYVRRLAVFTTPVLWRKLAYAFPSVVFVLNLGVYYTVFYVTLLLSPEGTTARDVRRMPFFDAFEYGPFETAKPVVIAIVLALVWIGGTRLMVSSEKRG